MTVDKRHGPSGMQSQSFYSEHTKRSIHIAVTVTSTFSLTVILATFYWFHRMKKKMRHKLIVLNIFGSFIRSAWFFSYAWIVMTGSIIATPSVLCQFTGFMINYGNGVTDLSILFLSIHGALQIFRPPMTPHSRNGLDGMRHWVYAITFLLPAASTSFAFFNPESAFTAQGAFCNLPARPIWYRLFISWTPRYVICIIVLTLAFAMYVHVELQFHYFSNTSTSSIGNKTAITTAEEYEETQNLSANSYLPPWTQKSHDSSKIRPLSSCSPNQESVKTPEQTYKRTSRSNHVDEMAMFPHIATVKEHGRWSWSTEKYWREGGKRQSQCQACCISTNCKREQYGKEGRRQSSSTTVSTYSRQSRTSHTICEHDATRTMSYRRMHLRRQLRLVFIYPVMYILMWTLPFILSTMQYTPRYANRPPPVVAFLATISLTLMGGIDGVVFLLRERPWQCLRHAAHRRSASGPDSLDVEETFGERPAEGFIKTTSWLARWKSQRMLESTRDDRTSDVLGCVQNMPVGAMWPSRTPLEVMSSHYRATDQNQLARARARERLSLEREDRILGRRARLHGGCDDDDTDSIESGPPRPAAVRNTFPQHAEDDGTVLDARSGM